MSDTVGTKLISEIERVSGLRGLCEGMRGMPQINVEPSIFMMTAAINRAKNAIESDDPIEVIAALNDLEGFSA